MIPSRPTASVLLSLLALLLVPFLLFLLPGCGGKSATAPSAAATATVSGLVRDAVTSTPIQGASVTASSGASGTSGADGRFTINVGSDQRVRIDVTRTDYSLNQAVVQLARNQTQTLTVNLIPAGTTTSIDVAAGGMVTDANSNATLTLPAEFVTASGSVHVRVTGLDPTTSQVKALPGGLDAVDADGHAVYLKPVSFAEYTVTDGAGNVLQFNPSASSGANIELPIPASLQGQPGYQNGDPIECYVYDTADGKWKTPVAGIIGPSSVDGQPAIKATIFHLSWYGGAPAAAETGCIEGTVMVDGSPAADVDVEAFAGGSTRTDAQGHYQVEAALNSTNVRVDATQASGSQFRIAEATVNVGAIAAVCAHLDLSLGAATDGEYQVRAELDHLGNTPPSTLDFATATITVGAESSEIPATGAIVEIGTDGTTWTTLPEVYPGTYELLGGLSLASGELYTMRFDFDHNGTFDASGQVRMSGVPVITAPGHGATVGRTFTASWTDEGTAIPGYSAVRFGLIFDSAGTVGALFETSSLSKVVGDGVADPITGLPNPPVPAGSYRMGLYGGTGPAYTALLDPTSYVPNITGTNASGFLSSFSTADSLSFVCSGEPSAGLAPRISATGARASAMPLRSSEAVQRVRELYKRWTAAAKRSQQRGLERELAKRGELLSTGR